jgi:predicted acylesterase/phospholipase RssA
VAIALSGGGYRAALLHAGVLSAIEERKLPIIVQAMSTVSGGSIIGSFYAIGGSPEEFLKAFINRRFNLIREILHIHVLSHLLLASNIIGTDLRLIWFLDDYNRTHVQARMLDRLFLKKMLFTESPTKGRPELMVCLTNLTRAALVGITPKKVVRQPIVLPLDRITFDNYQCGINSKMEVDPKLAQLSSELPKPEKERLSSLVAASGAFPVALKAYSPIGSENNAMGKKNTPLYSDGGILDNYGIILLYAAKKKAVDNRPETMTLNKDYPLKAWDVEFVIVSDGSAIEGDKPRRYPGGEAFRAVDVMYAASNLEITNAYFTPKNTKPPALALTPRNLCPGKLPCLPNTESEETCLKLLIASKLLATESLENIVKDVSNTNVEKSLVQKWLIDSSKSEGKSLADEEKEKALRVIVKQIKDCRDAFVETPTLEDQIDEQTARSIFLLGKYLVYLNEKYIRCLASKFVDSKTSMETKSILDTDQ